MSKQILDVHSQEHQPHTFEAPQPNLPITERRPADVVARVLKIKPVRMASDFLDKLRFA
ncbi:hypothetical protein ACFFWD_33835 [Bradyrhizobium erythrophlei]|uniref:hypothetical protein n=1 Tax=Bradyrhizobium erythrophlei TaxID=1437360 RepID=UPI0035F0B9FA